jgi:hypothetical protein
MFGKPQQQLGMHPNVTPAVATNAKTFVVLPIIGPP